MHSRKRSAVLKSPRWISASAAPGEFFGTRQHGLPEFKLADLTSEMDLLLLAKQDAGEILTSDPKLSEPIHANLRPTLAREFEGTLELASVG